MLNSKLLHELDASTAKFQASINFFQFFSLSSPLFEFQERKAILPQNNRIVNPSHVSMNDDTFTYLLLHGDNNLMDIL